MFVARKEMCVLQCTQHPRRFLNSSVEAWNVFVNEQPICDLKDAHTKCMFAIHRKFDRYYNNLLRSRSSEGYVFRSDQIRSDQWSLEV
mmetsp:Transcript_25757/g.61016  ORF Transcript_25757/g.61016 Transcript_25757/m.61016 type:complete len:88 (-) Transcript_25757:45-308(-)